MGILGEYSGIFEPSVDRPLGTVILGASISSAGIFRSSPPERIGVRGEYDYNGLAHRVASHFRQAVGDKAAQLKVRQRGCVVILTGAIASRELLDYLVGLANQVEGAALVELYRVTLIDEDAVA